MSETNASICKLCYPLVKGAEAVCDLHSARAEITKLKSQLEEARRGLKVALHALKDVDGPVIVYDGENGIFLAKERDCTCWDAEQTIRALLSAPTEARSVLEASNQGGK